MIKWKCIENSATICTRPLGPSVIRLIGLINSSGVYLMKNTTCSTY